MAKDSALAVYVNKHLTKVDGWAGTPESLLLLELLLGVQEGCDGYGAFEIGVHHGRYLIALHNACGAGSRSLGLDLFAEQARNVDGSGSGNMEMARGNMERYAREPDRVALISADSLAVSDAERHTLLAEHGPFRISSVDGGHTPVHAASDIRLAAKLTVPQGFISVDDFFHPNFSGVTEGVYQTIRGSQTPFVPWVVMRKKLFLAHVSWVDVYRARLLSELVDGGEKPKVVSITGHEVLSIYI